MAVLKLGSRARTAGSWRSAIRSGWLVLLLCVSPAAWTAPAPAALAVQVEAIFLFNFTQFVDWPADAFATEHAPLVIGVLGDDPFGTYLDDTVQGETVNGRPLTVQRYHGLEEIKTCHVLFIGRAENGRLKETLTALKGRSTLTVGDAEDFTRSGGMIQFATVENKIRLRINLEAARSARLTISSKLLRPAEIVGGGRD